MKTPEELRKAARDAAQPEVDNVIKALEELSKQGQHTLEVLEKNISPMAITLLEEAGYSVKKRTRITRSMFGPSGIDYWEISFK